MWYKCLLTWDARAYLKFWMYSGICPSAFKWEIQSDENETNTQFAFLAECFTPAGDKN